MAPAPTDRILVAPDSFKGTFTAGEVARAIGAGVERAGLTAEACPAADGGEGTLAALAGPLGLDSVAVTAHDPLGRPIAATFGLAADGGLALVETAAASGLALVDATARDAWAASTAGTGELIAAAARAGARTIVVATGGSATTDGGRGALEAIAAAGGLHGARLTVLCDVRTPFDRAAAVFAPQKGADRAQVRALGARLDALALSFRRDPRGRPATGCAGGLSGGLWAQLDAQLVPGAAWVLDALEFDARARGARAIVTGEGRIDGQSAEGKLVAEIGRRATAAGVPLYAVVGRDALDPAQRGDLGLRDVLQASTREELEAAGHRIATVVRPRICDDVQCRGRDQARTRLPGDS